MLTSLTTFAMDGLSSRRISVEVDVRSGLPAFSIVGLADTAVREARERVQAAIKNSGFQFPPLRVTANLAPATFRKVGPSFDLALALAVLCASGQVDRALLENVIVFGELSLGGDLRGCPGTLAIAQASHDAGFERLIVASSRAPEAALVDGLDVIGVGSLSEAVAVLTGAQTPRPFSGGQRGQIASEVDLDEVRGHRAAIHALTVAAAGGHNLLLQGPPGTGKTMLARRLPTLLPPLSRSEALSVARIKSVVGTATQVDLSFERPFRAPHHSISSAGLVGGGQEPTPGEVTLAHHGVLFLDEIAEFSRSSLEALRQPLEDGNVTIVRGQRAAEFPSRFMFVAATNACPCGFHGSSTNQCRCSEAELARYRRRLSGPLLDRIDLSVAVQRPTAAELKSPPSVDSAAVRERVLAARERQKERFKDDPGCSCNSELSVRGIGRYANVGSQAQLLLDRAYDRGTFSARGRARVIRVAQTLADLNERSSITRDEVLSAIAFRLSESIEASNA